MTGVAAKVVVDAAAFAVAAAAAAAAAAAVDVAAAAVAVAADVAVAPVDDDGDDHYTFPEYSLRNTFQVHRQQDPQTSEKKILPTAKQNGLSMQQSTREPYLLLQ